jgi:subtilase family serine protease
MLNKKNGTIIFGVVLLIAASVALSNFYGPTGAFNANMARAPDLQFSEFEVTDTMITGTVYNDGPDTVRSFRIGIYQTIVGIENWEKIETIFIDGGIGNHATKDFSVEWDPSQYGDLSVKAVVDTDGYIEETNEENNIVIADVGITSINPDIYVTNLLSNDEVIIVDVTNAGMPVEKEFTVAFFLKDDDMWTDIGVETVGGIKGADTITLTHNYDLPARPYELKIVVNANRAAPESMEAESNNAFEILIE